MEDCIYLTPWDARKTYCPLSRKRCMGDDCTCWLPSDGLETVLGRCGLVNVKETAVEINFN